jgi:hypothetical protein
LSFDNGAVTLGQTESYLDGKGVGFAMRTVAIATFSGDVAVDAD